MILSNRHHLLDLDFIQMKYIRITSGDGRWRGGKNYTADLTINNYKFISKILKRKSVGFAESYMDGDFSSSNLTNLLLLAFRNENALLWPD